VPNRCRSRPTIRAASKGVSIYRTEEKAFSVGNRIQFTALAKETQGSEPGAGNHSRHHGRWPHGSDYGWWPQREHRPLERHPHLDHGYVVTSHSSQGQTADRVLINIDTELGAKDLLNNRMAYVSVSRRAHDAQIFTSDREKLPAALGHNVSKQSAHVPELVKEQAPEIVPQHEHSYGFGIEM